MNTKIITIISIVIIVSMGIFAICFVDSENKVEDYDFTDITTMNVYKIWTETSGITDIHRDAYKELKERRFFDEQDRAAKKEAQEIFNKYSK